MKRDVFHVAGDRCILREQFRDAQEVQDRGYVIMGSGITFPGNGVRFTGAAGQRLVLPQTPSRALALTAFSAHASFTPEFAKADNSSRYVFEQDPAGGFILWSPTAGGLFTAVPGDWWKVSATAAAVRDVWREYEKNYVSYSVRNGELRIWMNGVQVGTGSSSPLPAAGSFSSLPLIIGASGVGSGYVGVFHGTIHEISWYDTTMTLEEHLDWMQKDTYSEVWGGGVGTEWWNVQFTTTKTLQSWTIKADVGVPYRFDWGDGTSTFVVGTGADQITTKNYGTAGTRQVKVTCEHPELIRKFDCASNQLTGSMPSLAACTGLQFFSCASNLLTGSLPSFAASPLLASFYCYGNTFTGSLPSFASNPALATFNCSSNTFSGTLSSFAACPALSYFACNNNTFSGVLPSFSANSQLGLFYCHSNAFSGTLPDFSACVLLSVFTAHINQFSGVLPSFGNCTQLSQFRINANNFTGSLPSFATCVLLSVFSIGENEFTGTLPSLATCTLLTYVEITTMLLSGELPSFTTCPLLTTLYAGSSHFSGALPSFSGCVSLVHLYIDDNDLTDYTPQTIATTCQNWSMSGNALSQTAVDAALADMATGMAGRPINGTMRLDGGTNGVPTFAGLANQAIIMARPWTCKTNAVLASVPDTVLWQGTYDASRATFNTQPVIADWDMEAVGTAAWPVILGPMSSVKRAGTFSGAGAQVLQGTTTALAGLGQNIGLPVGNRALFSGWMSAVSGVQTIMSSSSFWTGVSTTSNVPTKYTWEENCGAFVFLAVNGSGVGEWDEITASNLSLSDYRPAFVKASLAGSKYVQASAAEMLWVPPTLINGRGSIRMGTGDFWPMNNAAADYKFLHDGTGFTHMCVWRANTMLAQEILGETMASLSLGAVGYALHHNGAAGQNIDLYVANGSGVSWGINDRFNVGPALGELCIITMRCDAAGNTTCWKNSTPLVRTRFAINALSAANPDTAFRYGINGDANCCDQYLAARPLTDAEVIANGQSLAATWGIVW